MTKREIEKMIKGHRMQTNGSSNFYKYLGTVVTDGANLVADLCRAYWLLDAISIGWKQYGKKESFQVWKLDAKVKNKAVLTMEDGNNNIVYKQKIGFTDFPLNEVTLWCVNGTILLPEEY